MKYDVMIIGGGAAGLTAALCASEQQKSVLILEGASRIGRKILASGNGRCNLANRGKGRYFGGEALAKAVLSRCSVEKVLSFFSAHGLVTVEEEGGRLYPGCGQAAAVLDVLRAELSRKGVQVLCDCPVKRLEKDGRDWYAETAQGGFHAHAVVVSCGGMAGGKLGHDGQAYHLLTAHGHKLVPPSPALVPLIAEKEAVRGLSGLRLPAVLTLCEGKSPRSAAQGELLFTDYGISGVCTMQLSCEAGKLLQAKKKPVIYLDFSPMLGLCGRVYDRVEPQPVERHLPQIRALLEDRAKRLPTEALLCGLVPRLLSDKLRGLPLPVLAQQLSAYPVPIIGTRGMEYAQVTHGGIDTNEVFADTLQSRLAPGLYIAGEMLDVDGDCGGFNLQFAFASGMIAGMAASRRP